MAVMSAMIFMSALSVKLRFTRRKLSDVNVLDRGRKQAKHPLKIFDELPAVMAKAGCRMKSAQLDARLLDATSG